MEKMANNFKINEIAKNYVSKKFPLASKKEKEKIIKDWERKIKVSRLVVDDFKQRIGNPRGMKILDDGCGNGGLAIAFSETMAEIFGVNVPAISKHVDNIFREKELHKNSTVSKMEIVQNEGKRQVKRQVERYNLDMIIAVGYRINSAKATQFRIRATSILKDYLVKGFALNQKRLEETKLHELEQMVDLIRKNIKHK